MAEFSQIDLNGRPAWAIDHSEFTYLDPVFDSNIVWNDTTKSSSFNKVGHGIVRLKWHLRDEIKQWLEENSVEYVLSHCTQPGSLIVFDDTAAILFKLRWSGQ